MAPLTYWQQRAIRRVLAAQRQEDNALSLVRRAVQRALAEIQDAVDRIGRNFQKAFNLTPEQAREMLAAPADRTEYERLLREIADLPDGRDKQLLQARASSGAYAYRISREEAMRAHVEAQSIILGGKTEQALKATLLKVGEAEAVGQRTELTQAGAAASFVGDNLSATREILRTPWNGGDYSSRIWGNTQALRKALEDTIMSGFLSGRSSRAMAADIAKQMSVAYYQAERLVRTEVNRLQNAVALKELGNAGLREYEWLSTLDKRTCEQCGAMDGKVFRIEDAVIGKTLPPLHPYDRCIIVRHVAATADQTRFARDSQGNGIKVPAGTTYEQWTAQQGAQLTTQQNMARNLAADQAQFEEYRNLLGKNVLTSDFAAFQKAKYYDAESYALLKLDYRRRNALLADATLALPNADTATAADEKFTKYLFNPDNPTGWAKGVAFDSRLGYNANNWEQLKKAILQLAKEYPSTHRDTSAHGDSYQQAMILYGMKGKPANVIVGWMVADQKTWLTTAMIKKVKHHD